MATQSTLKTRFLADAEADSSPPSSPVASPQVLGKRRRIEGDADRTSNNGHESAEEDELGEPEGHINKNYLSFARSLAEQKKFRSEHQEDLISFVSVSNDHYVAIFANEYSFNTLGISCRARNSIIQQATVDHGGCGNLSEWKATIHRLKRPLDQHQIIHSRCTPIQSPSELHRQHSKEPCQGMSAMSVLLSFAYV